MRLITAEVSQSAMGPQGKKLKSGLQKLNRIADISQILEKLFAMQKKRKRWPRPREQHITNTEV